MPLREKYERSVTVTGPRISHWWKSLLLTVFILLVSSFLIQIKTNPTYHVARVWTGYIWLKRMSLITGTPGWGSLRYCWKGKLIIKKRITVDTTAQIVGLPRASRNIVFNISLILKYILPFGKKFVLTVFRITLIRRQVL